MIRTLATARGLLVLFGVLSLAAILVGCVINALSGAPLAVWIRNPAAWLLGAISGVALAATFRSGFLVVALGIAPVGLLATFVSTGQQDVHRWVQLGPLNLNAAMLLLPSAVVALAALAGERRWPWLAAFVSLVLLMAQPDASQATTLAAVMALIALALVRKPAVRAALVVAVTLLAALTWMRPDPLEPVPEVEGVIGLAAALSWAAAGLAVILLAAVCMTPAAPLIASPSPVRAESKALAVCLLLWAATPLLGAFPVPFIGVCPSPILGAWLGVGLLAGRLKEKGRQAEA